MTTDFKPTITAIVIAKNEVDMISNCLDTLQWCDEVVVIDHESTDATSQLAIRLGARVVKSSGTFADIRNAGWQACRSDWVIYIDADERVVPALAEEIQAVMLNHEHTAYSLSRSNVLYGHIMKNGGWNQDRVVRLFQRSQLVQWKGEIHEHAEITGSIGQLETQLLHLTHRNIVDGLNKSAEWTPLEAKLLYEANVKPVNLLMILRKGFMEVFRRAIIKKGYRDGLAGWVEALVQGVNRMLVYMQVWELQQRPTLPERYQKYESTVAQLWKRES